MRCCLFIAGILVTLGGSTTAIGSIMLAEHVGNIDPETEGWVRQRPFASVFTFPVTNDLGQGIDAWAVDDNGTGAASEGLYALNLSNSQVSQALLQGWLLSGNIRVVDVPTPQPAGSSVGFFFFTSGADPRAFGLSLGAEADGSPLVRFAGQVDIVLDLDDLDSGYHLYELLYDPSEQTTDLFVDGVLRYTGWAGVPTPNAPAVAFGSGGANSTGQGNYNLVRLEILSDAVIPEPSSYLIWLVFGGLVLSHRQNRLSKNNAKLRCSRQE